MPVFRLSNDLIFPDPRLASEEGLLAIGGDLSPERLLLAYLIGVFPWYGEGEPMLWWSPDPRCVILPDQLHVPRRLERALRQGRFRLSCNRAFREVMACCAKVRIDTGEGTWLVPEMQEAYARLHEHGLAHSVEAWQEDRLVGGLYGVAFGRVFCGESMFHRETGASQACLVGLVRHLAARGFALFDCQVTNPHLERMGARSMAREEFLALLEKSGGRLDRPVRRIVLPDRL